MTTFQTVYVHHAASPNSGVHEVLSLPDESASDGDEYDSTFGDTLSSTYSLTSTVCAPVVENDREYADWEPEYFLPNDEEEQTRMRILHEAWREILNGCLLRSKPKPGGLVVDVGTGTGAWAIDYADAHPDTTVIGFDISPIQPGLVPPNCLFELYDIKRKTAYYEPVHLTFGRDLAGAIGDWQNYLNRWFKSLAPGGCIELIEFAPLTGTYEDGDFERTETCKWSRLRIEAAYKAGRPIDVAPCLADMVRKAGFVQVEEEKRDMPVRSGEGKLSLFGKALLCGIEAMTMRLFTKQLGWPPEKVQQLCSRVQLELRNPRIRASSTAYIVCGRKPDQNGP